MRKIALIAFTVLISFQILAQVPNYVPTNGLVGWWPFTGNANDSSGNGNNGTVNGATLTTDRFGNGNRAYSFGGGDWIEVLNSNSLNSASSVITVSAWFNINNWDNHSNAGWFTIMSKSNSVTSYGNYRTGVTKNAQGIIRLYTTLNSDIVEDTVVINLNTWNQFTAIINDATNQGSLYLNGILIFQGSTGYTGWSTTDTLPLMFGMDRPGIIDYANGKIDDIGIWNRALTQQEITELYGCAKNLAITPSINAKTIGSNATFTASTTSLNPSYIWQSDLGQGFQTLNNVGQYSGTSTNTMSISNVQLSNHMEPIRAISTSGTCKDTSNIAYVKILDTCITKINDTVKITKYDTVKVTRYDTIKVTDTLVINATLSGVSAPNNTNRLLIYPNPAKDHITIDYGIFGRMSGYTLKIVNTLGQIVFSTPINQQTSYINLSTWTGKGMYYVQIYDASNTLTENRKIVLQ